MSSLRSIVFGVTALLLVAAMAFVAIPRSTTAQSSRSVHTLLQEIQQELQQLRERIQNRADQQSADTPTTDAQINGCQGRFTRNLGRGDTGPQVKQLQRFLNSLPVTQVAQAGPGSPGNVTNYYGPLTQSAVSEFQAAYAPQILAPLGLEAPTGFWGPSSRSQANAICTQRAADRGQDNTDQPDGDDANRTEDDKSGTAALQGGEGSIQNFEITTPNQEELSEGEEKTVLGFSFEAHNSDMRVERVDFLFEAITHSNDTEPWEYIESLRLQHKGETVATKKVSTRSAWSEQGNRSNHGVAGTSEYAVRLSGIDRIIKAGTKANFSLQLQARENIDSADLPQKFRIAVAEDANSPTGIRAIDALGINQYGGSTSDVGTVSFEEPETGNLLLSTHVDNPTERVVHVSDTTDTEGVKTLVMEADARDQDIRIEELSANATSTGSNLSNIVSSFNLVADGDVVASKSVPSTGTSGTVTFKDLRIDVPETGATKLTITANLQDTNNQNRYQDGDTLIVGVPADDIVAEETTGDQSNLVDSTLSGHPEGQKMHLYVTAPSFSLQSTSVNRGSADSQGEINEATYRITFGVQADETKDIHIPFYDRNNAKSIVASTTNGVGKVLSNKPSVSAIITAKSTSDSGVERKNDTWKIPAGSTGVFTLTMSVDNEGAPSDRFIATKIESLKWNTSDSLSGLTEFTFGLSDWETDSVFLEN